MIVRHIEQTYQYIISYLKGWRAKQSSGPAYLYPMFMIVVGYLSFVSIDTIDVNLLCLWVP